MLSVYTGKSTCTIIPPQTVLGWGGGRGVGILFSHCPSICPYIHPRPFFLNIFNRQWWNFIELSHFSAVLDNCLEIAHAWWNQTCTTVFVETMLLCILITDMLNIFMKFDDEKNDFWQNRLFHRPGLFIDQYFVGYLISSSYFFILAAFEKGAFLAINHYDF